MTFDPTTIAAAGWPAVLLAVIVAALAVWQSKKDSKKEARDELEAAEQEMQDAVLSGDLGRVAAASRRLQDARRAAGRTD